MAPEVAQQQNVYRNSWLRVT